MRELQRRVAAFVQEFGLEAPAEHRLLDLAAGLGERAKEALRGIQFGRRPLAATAAWSSELGAILFGLV